MRAAAILGLGCSPKDLKPFQADNAVEWRMGMPASPDQADVILLFGGDGTIHRHLGALVRLRVPVLVVPAGSGNDFARALGLHRVRDSLAAWQRFCARRDNVRAIDLGIISPTGDARDAPAPHDSRKYFCCVAGLGIDAEVARRTNELPRWLRGHGGYVLTLIPTIFQFAPRPVRILTPSEQATETTAPSRDRAPGWSSLSDGPTLLAAFANTPFYGDGMKIAPQAKMDDGLLDVCIVSGVGAFKLFCMFPTVYAGRHLKIREVDYHHAPRVRVETERPLDVYADGEYVCQTPIEIAIERASLQIVCP